MAGKNTAPTTVGDQLTRSPKPAKEKQKAVAFFNFEALDKTGKEVVFRSSKGFSMFENEYQTREERALIQMAKDNDGSVLIENCRIRIVLNQEKSEIDTSVLSVVPKQA